jgi:WD40 repeat protein
VDTEIARCAKGLECLTTDTRGPFGRFHAIAFSRDGKQLASGSGDGTARVWDEVTGAPLQTLEGHSESVLAVTFSPDGKQLASVSVSTMVRLWDTATGALLQTPKGHSWNVNAAVFSQDGKQLASGARR